MGGQIVAAPKQRNSDGEKADIKAGKLPDDWRDKPATLRQKDRDGRWTVKFSKAKLSDIAVPAFGYKIHASIDRRGARKAKVALARWLAVVLHRMWIDGTEFSMERPTTKTARPGCHQSRSS